MQDVAVRKESLYPNISFTAVLLFCQQRRPCQLSPFLPVCLPPPLPLRLQLHLLGSLPKLVVPGPSQQSPPGVRSRPHPSVDIRRKLLDIYHRHGSFVLQRRQHGASAPVAASHDGKVQDAARRRAGVVALVRVVDSSAEGTRVNVSARRQEELDDGRAARDRAAAVLRGMDTCIQRRAK